MKNLLIIIFSIGCFGLKAQTALFQNIDFETNLTNYTVSASYDTTFTRQLLITIADTIGFQNIQANLDVRTNDTWQTEQSVTLNKPESNASLCSTSLCMYRKNESQWILVLGSFPLSTRHRIQLHFNSQFTNTTNTDWELEF